MTAQHRPVHDDRSTLARAVKLVAFSILMIATAALLFVVYARPLFAFAPFESAVVNQVLNYQLSALPVAGLALLLTLLFAGRVRLSYLNLKRTGVMTPFIGRTGGGRWETDAWPIALAMAAIVGVATYLQYSAGGFDFRWAYIALVVPFAAMNAFTEEVVFRLSYVTVGDNDTRSSTYGLVMGSLVFGIGHYWGVAPNGLVGAIMSLVVGYILARSIQETKGFFWAFAIHFGLNLGTMLFVLNRVP